MLLAGQKEVYGQCPPGFVGTYKITIHKSIQCRIEVDYCLSTGVTINGPCDIHIKNIKIIGDCSNVLPVNQNGMYAIPWGEVVTNIAREQSNYNCFQMINLYPCDQQQSRPTNKVSIGGCYYVTEGYTEEMEYYKEYIPCDMNGISYCHQEFSFCEEFVNGEWKIKAIPGEIIPQFECLDENCYSICND
jgi:hypothetical protein